MIPSSLRIPAKQPGPFLPVKTKPLVLMLLVWMLAVGLPGCEQAKNIKLPPLPQVAGQKGPAPLDDTTIANGLKEALEVGTRNAAGNVGKKDGFWGNPQIRIPLPAELADVAKKVRQVGLGDEVDTFVATMNQAAENAAPQAVDIFVKAVREMTLSDVRSIWKGDKDAATRYFERHTRAALYQAFQPPVGQVMEQVGVTRNFRKVMDSYNAIPFVKKQSFDIDAYVTNKALDGLFAVLAGEEGKIRHDPAARVTDLLKKVFG
ncbi:MAG: DUF4197 domain-containing protein [Deltaproteobacteria bacterium]|nr:DUF4197 domain-containing protein [Deltaproteobacteria bacterium]